MELNLRSMGLGELLDRSLNLYRRNFLLFLAIVAIVEIPITLVQVLSTVLLLPGNLYTAPSSTIGVSFVVFYAVSLLLGLVQGIGMVIQMAALAVATSERYHERAITLKQAYGRVLRRWDTLLVLILIVGAANVGVFLVLFAPVLMVGLLGTQVGSSAAGIAAALGLSLACLGFIPAVVALIFLNTHWAFCIPAAMLEDLRATRALGRSWNLVKGYFWRILGTLFILSLFIYVLVAVPTGLISIAVTIVSVSSFVLATIGNTIVSTVISLLVTPIQYAVITLLYYDIRIRKEGYDLQVRADSMALPPSLTVQPGANPSVA